MKFILNMRFLKWLIVIIVVLLLFRWFFPHKEPGPSVQNNKIVTVTTQTWSDKLFYSGTIQPSKGISVVSPADGVIEDMGFHFGDTVKKGQLLFSINSEKFQNDYKTALMQYVKYKSELDNSQNQLKQGKFLHDNKLISDDELKLRKTNYYNSRLSLLQAKDVLALMLKQLDIKNINLYDLTIADIEKINAILDLQNSSKRLKVVAPTTGVALLPVKIDNASGDKKLNKGEQVKQGDVLTLIGNGDSVSIYISVNEFDINQIHTGQKVKITGAAFPDYILQGVVTGVDHQAQTNQSGIPSFGVQVDVDNLTTLQKKNIHVGMSAKVEISIEESSQLTIPIAAVTEEKGEAYVKLINPLNKQVTLAPIKVSKTTVDSVIVVSGIKAGDKILV